MDPQGWRAPKMVQLTPEDERLLEQALSASVEVMYPIRSELHGWQPIDTAPKDGRTVVFGYWEQHSDDDGNWRDYWQQYLVFWDEISGLWQDDGPNVCPFKACEHWAPLPPPPKQDT